MQDCVFLSFCTLTAQEKCPESHCFIDFRASEGITAQSVTSKQLTGDGNVLV